MLDKYIKTKAFTYIYSALLLVLAAFFVIIGWDGYRFGYNIIKVNDNLYLGIQVLVLITSVMLVVSSRLTDAMMPAMMIVVISTACYDSADKFLSPSFLWVAIPAVFSVLFHFVKYRKPFKIGDSFWGLCAVSLAVTLGGIGNISAEEYFSGTSLFYVFGLGIGLVAFYLLLKSQVENDDKQAVARIMYLVGILAVFSIFWLYISNWEKTFGAGKLIAPQFGNNLSTLIMMAMPFVLFYSSKRYFDLLTLVAMHVALVISGSRAGFFLGTLELVGLLAVYSLCFPKQKGAPTRRIVHLGFLAAYLGLIWYLLPEFASLKSSFASGDSSRIDIIKNMLGGAVNSGEARVSLIDRMFDDFASNPVFGVGIGNTGNTDIYNPVKGAMNWYHMWIPQIVGSLGAVGILAYGYQLVSRVRIFFKSPEFLNFTLLMSYAGLLLMSQVNPGEFCPVPYGMLAVTCFAFIERSEDDGLLTEKIKQIKGKIKSFKLRREE